MALSVEVRVGALRELLEQEVEQLLRKAIRQVFGNDVPVQRCVQDKLRIVVRLSVFLWVRPGWVVRAVGLRRGS